MEGQKVVTSYSSFLCENRLIFQAAAGDFAQGRCCFGKAFETLGGNPGNWGYSALF